MQGEPGEVTASLSTAVRRRADRYIEMLMAVTKRGRGGLDERALLECFERFVNDILDRHIPSGPRASRSLIFHRIYAVAAGAASTDPDRCRKLMAGLIAAETENRGPVRYTQGQVAALAAVFEQLGHGLSGERLPAHAELAFDRAALAHLQLGDHASGDRCLYARACARHRARRRGWVKFVESISGVLCGYGYRPYRLLGWIVAQLAFFAVVLNLLAPGPVMRNLYMVLVNYFNLLGIGDTNELPYSALTLLVIEGYTGAITSSVFFVLLVRRWFR